MEEGTVEETEAALTRHKTPKGVGGFLDFYVIEKSKNEKLIFQ